MANIKNNNNYCMATKSLQIRIRKGDEDKINNNKTYKHKLYAIDA